MEDENVQPSAGSGSDSDESSASAGGYGTITQVVEEELQKGKTPRQIIDEHPEFNPKSVYTAVYKAKQKGIHVPEEVVVRKRAPVKKEAPVEQVEKELKDLIQSTNYFWTRLGSQPFDDAEASTLAKIWAPYVDLEQLGLVLAVGFSIPIVAPRFVDAGIFTYKKLTGKDKKEKKEATETEAGAEKEKPKAEESENKGVKSNE